MSSKLCDNCQLNPKYGGHDYCGKGCAKQMADKMCEECGLKPKFVGFKYCSKTCSQTAEKKPKARTSPRPKMNLPDGQKPARFTPAIIQPYIVSPNPMMPGSMPVIYSLAGPQLPVPPQVILQPTIPRNPSISLVQPPQPKKSTPKKSQATPSTTGKGKCIIPECNKPVHVKETGWKSSFCSTAHRVKAVRLGMAKACIFCQTMPQSQGDYFCGAQCREDAMNKDEKPIGPP